MKKRLILGLSAVALGVGVPATYFATQQHGDEKIQTKNVKKMSADEQEKFLTKIADMVSNAEKPSDIEKALEGSIAKLSKENANIAFYTFLYSLSIEQEKQMENYRVISEGLINAYNKNEFKASRGESYEGVKDEAVKGYLNELNRQFLYVEDDGDGIVLLQDVETLEKKYGQFFDEGLKGLLEVRLANQNDPYANATYTAFNMKKNLERILFIEGKRPVWENTMYHDEMLALQEMAYVDFFGITHDAYFDEKDGVFTMKEDVKDEMWALMKEYSNSFLGDDILAYMDELETDDWVRKDEHDAIFKRMEERFTAVSEVQAPFVRVTPPQGGEEEAVVSEGVEQ